MMLPAHFIIWFFSVFSFLLYVFIILFELWRISEYVVINALFFTSLCYFFLWCTTCQLWKSQAQFAIIMLSLQLNNSWHQGLTWLNADILVFWPYFKLNVDCACLLLYASLLWDTIIFNTVFSNSFSFLLDWC